MALTPIFLGATQITDKDGMPTLQFVQLWQELINASTLVAPVTTPVAYEDQDDAIATVAIFTTPTGGLFRVSVYLRKTVPDGVASSLQVTVSWTDSDGASCSQTFAALTTDTATATQSVSLPMIRVDAASDIEVAVAYASTTPNTMHYDAVFAVEQLQGS